MDKKIAEIGGLKCCAEVQLMFRMLGKERSLMWMQEMTLLALLIFFKSRVAATYHFELGCFSIDVDSSNE